MLQLPRFLRQVVLVTLCFSLCVPLASAAPQRSEPLSHQAASRAGTLAEGFRALVARFWAKYGLGYDPNGARDQGKYGLIYDPNGARATDSSTAASSQCQGEYGAGYDPSGQCSDGR